jgi:hypothetical protein
LDVEAGTIEFKCDSIRCGAKKGEAVVLHYFSSATGEFLRTKRFRDPANHSRKEMK